MTTTETGITFLGFLFFPVAFVFFFRRPPLLLPLLVVASIFEAGSVFNGKIGSFEFGLSPFYFIQVLILIRLVRRLLGGTLSSAEDRWTKRLTHPLLMFFWWSVLSAFVMPRLFAGTSVNIPREGLDGGLAPLQWSFSNLAQACYLTLDVASVFFALSVIRTPDDARGLGKAFNWAILIAVTVVLLQWAFQLLHLPYPYSVLNNNPAYLQGYDQEIGNFQRISSTFTEPSSAGSFLGAAATGLLASYLAGKRGLRQFVVLTVVLFAIMETSATTAYATCAAMVVVLGVCFNPLAKASRREASRYKGWIAIATVGCIVLGLVHLAPNLETTVATVTTDKIASTSFVSRAIADANAIYMFFSTYGLGTGLGSNRPSSLIPALLSTVGIIGTATFALFLYRIYRLFPGRRAPLGLQITFWSLAGILMSECIAVPDITRPALWALIVIVVSQLNEFWARAMAIAQERVPSVKPQPKISPADAPGTVPAT